MIGLSSHNMVIASLPLLMMGAVAHNVLGMFPNMPNNPFGGAQNQMFPNQMNPAQMIPQNLMPFASQLNPFNQQHHPNQQFRPNQPFGQIWPNFNGQNQGQQQQHPNQHPFFPNQNFFGQSMNPFGQQQQHQQQPNGQQQLPFNGQQQPQWGQNGPLPFNMNQFGLAPNNNMPFPQLNSAKPNNTNLPSSSE